MRREIGLGELWGEKIRLGELWDDRGDWGAMAREIRMREL
jgi:hypothetical protein